MSKQRERDVIDFCRFRNRFLMKKRIKISNGPVSDRANTSIAAAFRSFPSRAPRYSTKNPLKQSTRKKFADAFPMARENEVTIRSSSRSNGLKNVERTENPLMKIYPEHTLFNTILLFYSPSCGMEGGREQAAQNPIWSTQLKIIR